MKRVIAFLKYRFVAMGFSLFLLILFATGTVLNGGLNMGIDFVGGVKIISTFEQGIGEAKIRGVLKEFNPLIQQIGEKEKNEYIISTKLSKDAGVSKNELERIRGILNQNFDNIEFLSVENVGPAIGDFLKKSAIKLFLIAIIIMIVYLSFRFEFKYSIGAIAALVHDIFISIFFCGIAGIEINIPVVAAILTIFGYSVNDTIVIFDRIRENIQVKSKQTFFDVINKSISQSVSRTLLTSLTTLFAVSSLYFLGGQVLNEFAMVLLFGIFIGTYSSVYVASPVLLAWERLVAK